MYVQGIEIAAARNRRGTAIGAKRTLTMNDFRCRVGAVRESSMPEILLLLVAVFQPNWLKVPVSRVIGKVRSSTDLATWERDHRAQ